MSASSTAFSELLRHLEARGLRVGVTEVLRAQAVLSNFERPDPKTFENVVVALFAKRPDDVAVVRQVVQAWLARGALLVPGDDEGPKPLIGPFEPRVVRGGGRRWLYSMAAILFVVGAGLVTKNLFEIRPSPPKATDGGAASAPAQTATTPAPPPDISPPAGMPSTVQVWVAGWIPRRSPWAAAQPAAVTALFASLLAGVLWRWRLRRNDPEPPPEVRAGGPTHYFLHAPKGGGRLLGPDEEAQAAWSVGRYLSEDTTPNLDLDRTIAATAQAGGVPHLVFAQATKHHRVWLWLDSATEDPTARALVDDLHRALTEAGLECDRAEFWGNPDILEPPDGLPTTPAAMEEGREGALVLVLTDGAELELALDRRDTAGPSKALLRELSSWPGLVFVDFGEGRVARLLASFDLQVLQPTEVIAYLGQPESPRRVAPPGADDLVAWCAAAALNPGPQDDASLLALRSALGLRVSSWHLGSVRAEARVGGENFRWPTPVRQALLRWLVTAEDPRKDDGLLRRAAKIWCERLDEEAETRTQEESQHPWAETEAARRLELSRALVQLFVAPEPAIEALYRLHKGGLAGPIGRQAAWLHPRGVARLGPEQVLLPWSLHEVSADHQKWLDEMGFVPDGQLDGAERAPPGRLWLALGLAVGLGVASGLSAVATGLFIGPGPLFVPDGHRITETAGGRVASTPRFTARLASPGADSELAWSQQRRPCVEPIAGKDAMLVRCGPTKTSTFAVSGDDRRYAAVAAPPTLEALKLAGRLVSAGTAGQVIVAQKWWRHTAAFHFFEGAEGRQKDQLVVLGPEEPDETERRRLRMSGRDVARVAAPWAELVAATDVPKSGRVTDRFSGGGLALMRGVPQLGPGPGRCEPPELIGDDRRECEPRLGPNPPRCPARLANEVVERWTCGTVAGIDGPARRQHDRHSIAYVVDDWLDAQLHFAGHGSRPAPETMAKALKLAATDEAAARAGAATDEAAARAGAAADEATGRTAATDEAATLRRLLEKKGFQVRLEGPRTRGRLVKRLLDQGAADEVFWGPFKADVLAQALARRPRAQVLLVGEVGDWTPPAGVFAARVDRASRLLGRLDLMGRYSLFEAMADLDADGVARLHGASGDAKEVRLVGPPGCPYRETSFRVTGTSTSVDIPFVWVCGGVFDMGANDLFTRNRPIHRVRISSFWLQRHEMTKAEASALSSESGKPTRGSHPLANIKWGPAKEICERLSTDPKARTRLPTEAEWEYAARGWEAFDYPWGDTDPTDAQAVFAEKLGFRGRSDPVESRPAGRGPFGAFDQAGNVDEWVLDAYDAAAYAPREGKLTIDPYVSTSPGGDRVFRGGSFDVSSEYLRSARRDGVSPVDEFYFLGFRCIRGSRRQSDLDP